MLRHAFFCEIKNNLVHVHAWYAVSIYSKVNVVQNELTISNNWCLDDKSSNKWLWTDW